jgi:hypothetical protein
MFLTINIPINCKKKPLSAILPLHRHKSPHKIAGIVSWTVDSASNHEDGKL